MTITSATTRQNAWQLCGQGRFDEARGLLVKLLAHVSDDVEAWVLLAKLHYQQNDQAQALAAAASAARLSPSHAEALYMLGRIYRANGALKEAEQCYRQALAVVPDNSDMLTSLGVLLRAQGRTEEAIALYERALALNPKHREAENNLGNALAAMGITVDFRKYREEGRSVLAAKLHAMRTSAETLLVLGKYNDAHALFLNALRIAPDDAELWLAVGRLECAHGRAQAGLDHVEQAARINPESAEINEIARRICVAGGLYERATQYAERILKLAPTEEIFLIRQLLQPCIQRSNQTICDSRRRYAQGLLDAMNCDAPLELPPNIVGKTQFIVSSHVGFFLAYHGENNRELQMQLARLYLKRMPGLAMTAAHCLFKQRRPGRIRVGFISRFFRKHSIGATTRGLVDRLSRERFEVYVLRITPSTDDATTQAIRASADFTIDLHQELSHARNQIAALELDILFFQDIGMEPISYFLAFARLAPVQCASFGHPDTTGIPNIDYFVSNDLFELDNAQAHYSEQLYLLKDLPTLAYYYKPTLPKGDISREKYGCRSTETLYVCPQALFKLHPDFDRLLDGILRGDPNGVIVLIDGLFKEYSEQLRQRFRENMPDTAHRVRFVPRLPYQEFLEFLSIADVILDTIHFNGMNTSLEAFALGVPVVTLPTNFQRGRHTQAMYKKMQIDACIAASPQDYIDIAVRIGVDAEYAGDLRRKIQANNHVLFEDHRVVEEFERFFLDATRAWMICSESIPELQADSANRY